VLRDLAGHRPRPRAPSDAAGGPVEPLSPDEIDAVRRRLESLGYL
jgi:hypothetical protein